MAHGIFVLKSYGNFYTFTVADDSIYDPMEERLSSKKGIYSLEFVAGKKGIGEEEIDGIADKVRELVKKANDRFPIDFKKTLESILDDIAVHI